jgi:hypothetical protein
MDKVKLVVERLHLPANWELGLLLGVGCIFVGLLLGKAGGKGGCGKMLALVVAVVVVLCTGLGSQLSVLLGR